MPIRNILAAITVLVLLISRSIQVFGIGAQDNNGKWRYMGLAGLKIEEIVYMNGYIFATTPNGVFRKQVKVADTLWTPIGFQGTHMKSVLAFDHDTILVSKFLDIEPYTIYKTTNGGESWQPFQNGWGAGGPEYLYVFEKHPHYPNTIYAAGVGSLAKSTDRGYSWELIWGSWQTFGTGVKVVEIDPYNTDIIWGGGQDAVESPFLLKSEDGGKSWSHKTNLLQDVSVTIDVAIHPENNDIVYLGMESYMLKTTDGGSKWEEILHSDGRFYFGIAINPENPKRMYNVSWLKTAYPQPLILMISDDGGETWSENINQEVEWGGAIDLVYRNKGNSDSLYIALDKGGVYEYTTSLPTSVDSGPVVNPVEINIYPNPSRDHAEVSYSVPEAGNVQIKVFDITGNVVSSTPVGYRQKGSYRSRISLSGAAPGAYYLSVSLDGRHITGKILSKMH